MFVDKDTFQAEWKVELRVDPTLVWKVGTKTNVCTPKMRLDEESYSVASLQFWELCNLSDVAQNTKTFSGIVKLVLLSHLGKVPFREVILFPSRPFPLCSQVGFILTHGYQCYTCLSLQCPPH